MKSRSSLGSFLRVPLVVAFGLYLRLALATTRWTVHGQENLAPFATRDPAIFAFWHERLALTPALWRHARRLGVGRLCYVLISRHRDGQAVARLAESLGAQVITGSTDTPRKKRGGVGAQRKLLGVLDEGDLVALTPDGPRGPRRQAAPGIAQLAGLAGVPVVPVGAQTTARLRLPSWDRFVLPLPFGRGVLVCGTPLRVNRELYDDSILPLTRALNQAADQADALCAPRHPGRLPAALWRVAASAAAPVLRLKLRARARAGREIAARLAERRGLDPTPRPAGKLLWIHASSVGETTSILPVIQALPDGITVLLTTGTVTGAALAEQRLPRGRALHRFAAWDVPGWVARFLDHWQPDAACFVESELWPNSIAACARRNIPLALVNARLSERSADRWEHAPGLARRLLGAFRLILAQSDEDAARLGRIGAPGVRSEGNLKLAAPRLPVDTRELDRLRALIGDRPVWLAASTHPGEEAIAGDIHRRLAPRHPGLLTIVAPRHAERGEAVAALLDGAPRRSLGQDPGQDPQDPGLWVVDTMGELGLCYRLARVVFVGKSLAGQGGQNPVEPAQFGCAVAIGPHASNFASIVRQMRESEGIAVVATAEALAEWVEGMLSRPVRAGQAGRAARQAVSAARDLPSQIAGELAVLANAAR